MNTTILTTGTTGFSTIISYTLTIDGTTITRDIMLNKAPTGDTTLVTVELLTNKGRSVLCDFTTDDASVTVITFNSDKELLFKDEYVIFDIEVAFNSTNLITNLKLNALETTINLNEVSDSTTITNLSSIVNIVQVPNTNVFHVSPSSTCTITEFELTYVDSEETVQYLFSSTGYITLASQQQITINASYTDNSDTKHSLTLTPYIYHTNYVPNVSSAVDISGLYKDSNFTTNTDFIFSNIIDFVGTMSPTYYYDKKLSPFILSNVLIADITGNLKYEQSDIKVLASTDVNHDFNLDTVSNLPVDSYNMYVNTNVIDTFVNESTLFTGLLTSGDKYYTSKIIDAITITSNSVAKAFSLTSLGYIFNVDPTTYNVPLGGIVSFTSSITNEYLSFIRLTPFVELVDGKTYILMDGTLSINGVALSDNYFIYDSEDSYTQVDAYFIEVSSYTIDSYEFSVSTTNPLVIENTQCNTYKISNLDSTPVDVVINKVVYSDNKDLETEVVQELNLASGESADFTSPEDGIYTLVYTQDNVEYTQYIISICNIEECILQSMLNVICTDGCTPCIGDCDYGKEVKYITVMNLYSSLKDGIAYVLGINNVYNTIDNDKIHTLFSISDIISKLTLYCNSCHE